MARIRITKDQVWEIVNKTIQSEATTLIKGKTRGIPGLSFTGHEILVDSGMKVPFYDGLRRWDHRREDVSYYMGLFIDAIAEEGVEC